MGKQAYKLELPKKWRIHDIFHVTLLEQDTTRKGRVDKTTQLDFEAGNDKKYKVEGIRDSAVYAIESEADYLSVLYYLVNWKGYSEEERTCKTASVVQHLQKLLNKFHQENYTKPTATPLLVDSAPPWLGPSSSLPGPPNKSEANQPRTALIKGLKRPKPSFWKSVGFPPQSPVIGLGGFLPVTCSFFLRLISFLTELGYSH